MYYLEIVAAIGLKVGLSIPVNDLMSIKGQGQYLTLIKGHSDVKVKTCLSQKLSSLLEPNFI